MFALVAAEVVLELEFVDVLSPWKVRNLKNDNKQLRVQNICLGSFFSFFFLIFTEFVFLSVFLMS